ncbi:hypothetical protein P167DRAFT_209761 [Morchella conica CCBAS932]|uniref:Mid2 domain-containing protein n=1 Tax=Morchella conica CCBAS932 TaxID=1392247 RepID=A0A3N4L0W9_9PEZI|nr:hypothetical protein P167DRAFT_209761 [Morchella conica CCBAS932]
MNSKLLRCVLASCVFLRANAAPQQTLETVLISNISSTTTSNANTTTTSSVSSSSSFSSSSPSFSSSSSPFSSFSFSTPTTTTWDPTTYFEYTYTRTSELPTSTGRSRPTNNNTIHYDPSLDSQGIFEFALWAKIVIPLLVVIGALGFVVYCWRSRRRQGRMIGMLRSLDVVEEKKAQLQGEMKDSVGAVGDMNGDGMQVDRIQSYPERNDEEMVRPRGL